MVEVLKHWLAGDDYTAAGGGFMGKTWDSFVPGPAVWRECLRVLKPGGHMLAFFGSRTYDMGTLAIRLAGFEIRDQTMWLYGSGMAKGELWTQAKANKGQQESTELVTAGFEGWGRAGLKPAHEPICIARKPLRKGLTVAENVLEFGTGALNIDACRVEPTGESRERVGEASQENRYTESGGTNFAAKLGIRSGDPIGRFPANLIHDGSDEVLAAFPKAKGQQGAITGNEPSAKMGAANCYGEMHRRDAVTPRGDAGSAARFYYCAKASRKDRNEGLDDLGPQSRHGTTLRKVENTEKKGNIHPTVKPTDLMRYLCRLITPPGGIVLDPFNGSGSTGKAAVLEGFRYIGIDMDPAYIEISRARIQFALDSIAPLAVIDEPAVVQFDMFATS